MERQGRLHIITHGFASFAPSTSAYTCYGHQATPEPCATCAPSYTHGAYVRMMHLHSFLTTAYTRSYAHVTTLLSGGGRGGARIGTSVHRTHTTQSLPTTSEYLSNATARLSTRQHAPAAQQHDILQHIIHQHYMQCHTRNARTADMNRRVWPPTRRQTDRQTRQTSLHHRKRRHIHAWGYIAHGHAPLHQTRSAF
jgi:hypothetical protein